MAEPIIPIPKEYEGIGQTVAFGSKKLDQQTGQETIINPGTTFYLRPQSERKYAGLRFDGKPIREFTLWDKTTKKDIGRDSATIHMYAIGEKNGQTVLRSNPDPGEHLAENNVWGVRLMTDVIEGSEKNQANFVDIPMSDLTKEKPVPQPKKNAEQRTTPPPTTPDDAHEVLVGYADGRQDNVGNGEPNIPFVESHAIPSEPPTPPEPPTPAAEPQETFEHRTAISFIGIDRETVRRRAMDLAKTAIEGSRNILKKLFSERFEEKFYQHAMKMLEAAQTPFAKESITLAQAEAKKRYDNEMNSMNGIQKGARKTWDTIKEYTFGSTTLEHYTIDALVHMRDSDPVLLKEQEAYRSEQQAMAKRFEGAFNDSDIDIRKNLGEKLLILDPTKPEHTPMVDGIKAIVKDYYTKKEDGTYMTDAELQDRLDHFYADTIRTNTPEGERIFADAETYASSLTAVAKEMKSRIEHVGGLEALDAELGTMEVRLGIGIMGEATEMKKTSTRNVVEWLERKGLYTIVSDAALGSAVSAILALKVLPQAALSSTARMWLGATGGGAVAGILSGRREYARRQVELRRVVAQKEAGVVTPDSAKQRKWYESFDFRLRTADELVDGMQKSIYTAGGTLKNNLTEDELRTSLAHLADAKARKALSSREKNRFGLIVLGAVGEQETNRTHLDQMVKQTEKDLTAYLDGHQTDAAVVSLSMGATGTEYIGRLTAAQTSVLQEGNDVLHTMTDPAIKLALSPLSSYTPEVDKLRYTLGIFGKAENRTSKGTGSGLDAVLKDFNNQATAEGARMGLKTAGIGIGVGALVNEAVMDIKYGWGSGALSRLFTHPDIQPALAMATAHAETIGGRTIMLGPNMDIDAQGNLDVMDAAGHIHHDVVTNFASHIQTDANGMHLDKTALDALHHAGLNPSLSTQEMPTQSIQHTTVPSNPTELPGAMHVTDASGVDHTAMWSIPNGTHLVQGADSHTFALVGLDGNPIITGIHTDANGAITNFEEIRNHLPDGWTIRDIPQQFTTEGTAAIDDSTRTINVYTDLHEGGMWQWAQEHVAGTPVEHQNAALNVIKNVWKSYQNVLAHDANITFDETIPGYENIARSVPHLPNGDIWPNAIPNNSVIELPNALFSDHNMAHLAQWSDQAVRMYDAELLANPSWTPMMGLEHIQAENPLMGLILRIGRFGMVSQERLSADELNMLMHALSATDTPANVVTDLHSIVFTETLSNTVPNTTIETVLTAIPQFAGPEGFIPIIPIEFRKGLEALGTKPIPTPEPSPPVTNPPPYRGKQPTSKIPSAIPIPTSPIIPPYSPPSPPPDHREDKDSEEAINIVEETPENSVGRATPKSDEELVLDRSKLQSAINDLGEII